MAENMIPIAGSSQNEYEKTLERRRTLEVGFVDNILARLASKFDKRLGLEIPNFDELGDCVVKLSTHRIIFVTQQLIKKLKMLTMMVGGQLSESSKQKEEISEDAISLLEQITYFIGLLGQSIEFYFNTFEREYSPDSQEMEVSHAHFILVEIVEISKLSFSAPQPFQNEIIANCGEVMMILNIL